MDRDLLFHRLLDVLEKCGIRCELRDLADDELIIGSGLCEVESQKVLIVDKRLNLDRRIGVILKTLKSENTDDIFIPPAVRDLVESADA